MTASALQCKSLNIVDVDHRLLNVHHRIIGFMKKKAEKKINNINWDSVIKDITFSFPAGLKKKEEKENVRLTIKKLCGDSEKECRDGLDVFYAKLLNKEIESIRYILAPLHEVDFKNTEKNNTVFYLSNAIDPHFSSEKQNLEFLSNFSENLSTDKQGILIYHQSGKEEFGIYTVYGKNKAREYCADEFITKAKAYFDYNLCEMVSPKEQDYFTFLDKISGTKKKNNFCSNKK